MSHIHPPGRRPYCLRSNDAQRGRNTGDAYGPVSRLLLTYHRTHRRARSQRYASSAPPLRSLSLAGEPRGPFPTRFSLSPTHTVSSFASLCKPVWPATAAKRGGACALNSHQRSLPGLFPINLLGAILRPLGRPFDPRRRLRWAYPTSLSPCLPALISSPSQLL